MTTPISREDLQAQYQKALKAVTRSRYPQAEELLQQLIEQAQTEPEILCACYDTQAVLAEYMRDLALIKQRYPVAIQCAAEHGFSETLLDLQDRYAEALCMYGEYEAALTANRSYLESAQAVGDQEHTANAARVLAQVTHELGLREERDRCYALAFQSYRADAASDLAIDVAESHIMLLKHEHAFAQAEQVCDTLLDYAQELDDPDLLRSTRLLKAHASMLGTEPERARALYEDVLHTSTAAQQQAEALIGLVRIELLSQHLDAAQTWLDKTQPLTGDQADLYNQAFVWHAQAMIDVYRDPQAAVKMLEQALGERIFVMAPIMAIEPLQEWAYHAERAGQAELASQYRKRAEQILHEAQTHQHQTDDDDMW